MQRRVVKNNENQITNLKVESPKTQDQCPKSAILRRPTRKYNSATYIFYRKNFQCCQNDRFYAEANLKTIKTIQGIFC